MCVCLFYNTYTKGIPIEEGSKEDAGIQAWERDCFSEGPAEWSSRQVSGQTRTAAGRQLARSFVNIFLFFKRKKERKTPRSVSHATGKPIG